mgnify:FL=1
MPPMDIDIWVLPSTENADAVFRALRRFGAPFHNLAKSDLQTEGTIFQIGVAPRRIDIITAASGLQFEAMPLHSREKVLAHYTPDAEKVRFRLTTMFCDNSGQNPEWEIKEAPALWLPPLLL